MTEEMWLKEALRDVDSQMRENSLEGFKAGGSSLIKEATRILEDIHKISKGSDNRRELDEKCFYLKLYLKYLKSFCERIV